VGPAGAGDSPYASESTFAGNPLFIDLDLLAEEGLLTEEELAVYKRGRNAHVHTIPHNASRADYLKATALECLLGWLYLRGEKDRINRLFAVMMEEDGDAA